MRNDGSWRKMIAEILSLAYPIIVGMASATVMHFSDTWMVARLGEESLAAIVPGGLLLFCFVSFFLGLLSCTNTFVGQSYGEKRFPDCSRYTWQGLYVALGTGVLAFLLWPIAPALFTRIGHEVAIREREISYFRWRLPSIWSLSAVVALSAFFQATGRPRLPMFAALLANAVNILLNYALIFGRLGCPRLEIQGAAIATSIGAALQAVILFAFFLSKRANALYHPWEGRRIDLHRLRELVRTGWWAGMSFLLDIGSWSVFITVMVGRFGKVALAASNAVTTLMHLSFMPTLGLSIAVTALVGKYIGQKKPEAAKERATAALALGLLYMVLMGLGFFLFRRQLVGLFAAGEEVVQLGSQFLILAAIFQAFDAIAIISSGALKGAGDTRWPALVAGIYAWVFFLPAAYILGQLWGAAGTWLAVTFYAAAVGLTLLRRFRSERWRDIKIFLPQIPPTPVVPEETSVP